MSGYRLEGDVSGNVAEVDAGKNLNVTLPTDPTYSGHSMLAAELGAATDPTGRVTQKGRISSTGRLTVGQSIILLHEAFNNTTLNSALFTAPVTTMTVACASGTMTLNSGSSTATSAVARVSSYMFYPLYSDMETYMLSDVLLTQSPQANNTVEIGLFQASGTTAPIDGVFFRYDSAGSLKAVVNTNGAELTSVALSTPSVGVMHKYQIYVQADKVLFYIDDVLQASIAAPAATGSPTYCPSQPVSFRTYNGGSSPSLAQVVKVGYVTVGIRDATGLGKPSPVIAALQGKTAHQGQTGQTMGSTALYTNSLAPGAGAAMTNTTAALGSGLGGQFSALPTLAANTDGIVGSYQNPAATIAIPGKILYITGVKIQSIVTTVLAGGPIYYAYSLAFGHTAVSLATAEAATTKAPRRVALGYETYAANAAVGTLGSTAGISSTFLNPIPINPGEFVQVVAKNIGTVTTTGVITFLITFDGFWE